MKIRDAKDAKLDLLSLGECMVRLSPTGRQRTVHTASSANRTNSPLMLATNFHAGSPVTIRLMIGEKRPTRIAMRAPKK